MKQIKVGQFIGLNSGGHSFFPMCILFFLMVFFSSTKSFGDSPRTTGTMQPGQRWGFYKSGESYSRGIWDKVGYELIPPNDYGFYENGMVWNLTNIISQSATITSCQLTFYSGITLAGATSNGDIVFKGIPWNFYDNDNFQTVYDQILNGPLRGTIAITTMGQYTISLPTWISDIQDAVQSSSPLIGLGAYNSGPPLAKGTSFGQVYLTINYTLPIPAPPTNLRRTSPTALSFTLEWDAPTGEVTGYKVFKNGSYYGTTSSTNMLISDLCPNTSYSMYIIPYNSHGDGDVSSTVNLSTLAYSITIEGEATVCISPDKTFTFLNRPSGIDITWTQSGNLEYVSGQGTDNYVVRASSSGSGWVQATLSSGCSPTVPQYPVLVGSPTPSITAIKVSGPGEPTHYDFTATFYAGATYNWYVNNSFKSSGSNTFDWYFQCRQTSSVKCNISTSCGTSSFSNSISKTGECRSLSEFTLSPNPASETVTITKKVSGVSDAIDNTSISEDVTTRYTIRIVDLYGALQYSALRSGDSFTFPVSGLKDGQYIVQLTDGKNTTSLSLIVKH